MALSNMRTLLAQAARENRAVGAFGVSSIEMIMGVVEAAESLNTPVILQVAEVRLPTTPLPVLGAAMLAAAGRASVPVAVHLDHGLRMDTIRQALDVGFTSVMFDGSALSMEENIQQTLAVMDMARPFGAAVEAEIGRIGRTESGEDAPAQCARPEDCLHFIARTGVDALAVAIGNAHGVYVGAPHLHFDILEQVSCQCATPLVLHGGTGISDEDFHRCIRLGVRKINIATATFQAAAKAAEGFARKGYFAVAQATLDATRAVALRHMEVFGTAVKGGTTP